MLVCRGGFLVHTTGVTLYYTTPRRSGFSYYHDYDAKEKINGVPTPVSVYHCVEYKSPCKAKVWIRDGNYHKVVADVDKETSAESWLASER
jgi:hypothetical protein